VVNRETVTRGGFLSCIKEVSAESARKGKARGGLLVEICAGENTLGGVVVTEKKYGLWQSHGISRSARCFRASFRSMAATAAGT